MPSIIAQLAKHAAYKQAIDPALLSAGLGSLFGGAGGYLLDPGKDDKGKKRSRLRNALYGALGGGALGGIYGHYNRTPDLKEEDVIETPVPAEVPDIPAEVPDIVEQPAVNNAEVIPPAMPYHGADPFEVGNAPISQSAIPTGVSRGAMLGAAAKGDLPRAASTASRSQLFRSTPKPQAPAYTTYRPGSGGAKLPLVPIPTGGINLSNPSMSGPKPVSNAPVLPSADTALKNWMNNTFKADSRDYLSNKQLSQLPVPSPKLTTADPFEVGNAPISSYKDQARALGVGELTRSPRPKQMTANPFEEGNAPISSYKDQARALGLGTELFKNPKSTMANPFEEGNAPISSYKDQARALGLGELTRSPRFKQMTANPFEVGNADITPKSTSNFSILDRVLAQKPNSASVGVANKAPTDILESGLSGVRNLPPVAFNRPTQLPQRPPKLTTGNPFEVGNAPISSYKDQARALGLGTELTRGPVAPKSTKANPFEIGNAQFTQDPRVLMQSVRPAIAQGLNQFLQNPRVANSMLPNARANIMQHVQPPVQLKPQQPQVSQPSFYDWLRSGRFLRSNGQGTGYGI